MLTALLPWLAIAVGLAALVWGADRFVDGAASLARALGLPALFIGMVVIGFGTSAPELLVSGLAAWQGNPGIALGNVIGSNIANIALILGATALISAIPVHSGIVRRELPALAVLSIAVLLPLLDGNLSRIESLVMLVAFAATLWWLSRPAKVLEGAGGEDPLIGEELEQHPQMPFARALLLTLVGLVVLVAGARGLVWGAVEIARGLGVSELIIGLTIVAVGTSLPELASGIGAALKRQHDLALGNILGSNLFNLYLILPAAALVRPLAVESDLLWRDYPIMLALTLLLWAIVSRGQLGRPAGTFFIVLYVAYTGWLIATVLGQPAPN